MNEAIRPSENTQEIVKAEALPVSEQAKTIVVKDQTSLSTANEMYLLIDKMRKRIKSVFEPIVEKAKEAKKKADEARAEALHQWELAEAPLVAARAYLDTQIVDYKREQDRLRMEEEERLRQEAIKVEMERRKKEEEDRLSQAAELEKAGATEEAETLIRDTIQEQAEPVQVYVAPPSTPKVELKGMATVTTWHAEVTDLKALCLAVGQGKCPGAYVEANLPALNKQAISLKAEMRIPGVKAVPETKSKPTGR